jgi:hypothetical protein
MWKSPSNEDWYLSFGKPGCQGLFMPELRFCAPDIRQVCLFKKEFLFSDLGETFLETKVERIGM